MEITAKFHLLDDIAYKDNLMVVVCLVASCRLTAGT